MRRLRISPAMVVAVAALFVALSGAAVAGTTALINGSQIKDHSIALKKLTPLAVVALRGHAGAKGPAGAAGPAGPAGPAGGFDPAKVTYVQGATTTVQPGQAVTLTATCPAGAKAIAGGGFTSILIIGASLPTQDGTSWNVIVANPFSSAVDSVFGFAVCAAK